MFRSRWLVPLLLAALLVSGCAQIPQAPETPPLPTTAQAGETTIVAVSAPQPEKQCCSIWQFLGVPQIFGGLRMIGTRIRSRLGSRFPGLEPRPPLLTITDPANLGPEASPAVQTAAEVKAEEDQAAQKAKAINYLATLGCGGCDRGIEEALLAALDDCTEEVRHAAAKAFRDLSGNPCSVCKTDSCCSEAVLKKLNKVAYDTKDGCYVEPSPRVRRMARLALAGCGGYVASVEMESGPPGEGPTPADLPPGAEGQSVWRGGRGVIQQASAQVAPSDPVLAEVNGEPIYLSQVAAEVNGQLEALRTVSRPETSDALRRSIEQRELDKLIDRKLLVQEARRHLSPEQISRVAYQTVVSPGRRPERILADAGRELASEQDLASTWLQRKVSVSELVSEQELERYYHGHLAEFQAPAQVRWEQITVSTATGNSPHHAASVIRYLHGVAHGRPTTPAPVFQSQDVATRVFPLSRLDQVPSRRLAEVLLNQPLGRVGEPWQDAQGWHLIRVLERRPAETMSLGQVRESVRAAIVSGRRAEAELAYVRQLRQQARIWTAFPVETAARASAENPAQTVSRLPATVPVPPPQTAIRW